MKAETLRNLKKAVIEYDQTEATRWAKKAVENGIDPLEAADALIDGVREVGDGYARGELFLPDLVGAANAMTSGIRPLEEEISRKGQKRRTSGTVVIGTVLGDIHDIGKALVATMLTAGGFAVFDLGVDVSRDRFLSAVNEQAPDILAMSSLLTTTAPEQRKVIEALQEQNLREKLKVMVGGGAITEEFARSIGADGYAPTAPESVGLAERLVKGA
jgi:corrinoid protein of di/trimethylamine methyltransferase